ncbi:MAG: hypothetical protein MJE68_00950 [Proteobacteria bacterium]|nr:hypothetical protein [Pseudomonadota bacterium]
MVGHVLQERLIGHLLQHRTNQRPPVSCIVELCTWMEVQRLISLVPRPHPRGGKGSGDVGQKAWSS